jgi:serine/threonine-protein kinase
MTRLTVTGMVIGTPAFMAPELIEGNDADQRSDIYSLGLVLYYCLGGKLPWEGLPTPIDIMMAVRLGGIDVSGLDASPSLQSVLGRATARKPEDRYQDAAALGDALLATTEGQALQAPGRTVTVRVPRAR